MINSNLTLLTDFYQLTMLNGYYSSHKLEQKCCFELFFRKLPFHGGFAVAAGLETAINYLQNLHFTATDIKYLKSLKVFSEDFLGWLASFSFQGDLYALQEGEIVFAGQPILRVQATLPEAQLVESALLNIINFQTLIATKAARIYLASKKGSILEFGLRRAQGADGALSATRASFIGGCEATSNVLASKTFAIPAVGTHAHSWIMSFPSELEAFRAYSDIYPDSCSLLVDTYDTLASGVPHAITVGQELKERGYKLKGIRLDSGDLAYLSKRARTMLDSAGLEYTKIIASNDLDEYLISDLIQQGAKIDVWGVGTNLVTAQDQPALGGVYKLVAAEGRNGVLEPRIKISSNPEKTTLPHVKQIWRAYSSAGQMRGDALLLVDEAKPEGKLKSFHPHYVTGPAFLSSKSWRPLLEPVILQGKPVKKELPTLQDIRATCLSNIDRLPIECERLINPQVYWVGISEKLRDLRDLMLKQASLPI